MRPCHVVLVLVAATFATASAQAQPANGFALDRFNPSERGSDWFALDSLDLRGNLRPAVGVVGDYGYRPLVIYNADGSVRTPLVGDQLFVHLGAALNLWDRLRVAFDLPLAPWQDGTGGTLNGVTYPAGSSGGVGDLRLSADLRLLGTYGKAFTLALGLQTFAPTGNRSQYLSDGSVRLLPRLQAAGEVAPFVYAASLGFQYHAQNYSFGANVRGSEIVFAASAGVRVIDRRLIVGPEIYGTTDVTDSGAFFAKAQTPVEAILGAHLAVAPDWRIGAGAGAGLTRGLGEPVARVLATVEWMPAVKEPEPPPPEPPPPPPPPPEPPPPVVPEPPPDRDHDGIPDAEDACPDVPGVRTDDPKTNGCPSDRDKDGIPDTEDACPDVPGPRDPDPKKNGCPIARVEAGQVKILDQIKFKTGSAVILPESQSMIDAVTTVLKEHAEIKRVRVEGHTDTQGTAPMNLDLSKRRAASVVTALVAVGIDRGRLTSQGYGQEKPLDTNATAEGRANNRRVEFHIEDDKK
jgi:OOP family OmpA-OmpF porin